MEADNRIVVFGAGAVGSYLGAKLASLKGPLDLVLIGRKPFVEAVRSHGLRLREGERELVTEARAVESADEVSDGQLIILTVKAYDLASSIPSVRSVATQNSRILAIQNGVGSEDQLIEAFGAERVFLGTMTTSVSMDEPGFVVRNGSKGGLAIAPADGSQVPASLAQTFQDAGLPPQEVGDYPSLRWSKLLLNLPGTATTAILDCDMVTVMNDPSLFRVEQLAFREAVKVVTAQRIRIVPLPDYPAPLMVRVMSLPASLARPLLAPRFIRSRGGKSPSLRGDLARGRTEIDYLNGAVARDAERVSNGAPVNTALTNLIRELVHGPEMREEFRGRPQRLLSYLRERNVPT